jgi:hypothetical protein
VSERTNGAWKLGIGGHPGIADQHGDYADLRGKGGLDLPADEIRLVEAPGTR